MDIKYIELREEKINLPIYYYDIIKINEIYLTKKKIRIQLYGKRNVWNIVIA